MNNGIRTVIYPVRDLEKANKLFSRLLGIQPYMEYPNYAGFQVGDQEIGLVPNGLQQGMLGPLGYYSVDDIRKTLENLLEAGAQTCQEIKDVGGDKLVTTVISLDGNHIGLIQMP